MQVASVLLTTIVHATEDTGKVISALEHVCPPDLFPWKLDIRRVKGHYGNEITTLASHIRGRLAESFFNYLLTRLSALDRSTLERDIDSHIDDEERLHLRVDKQASSRRILQLARQDPIKIQLTLKKVSNPKFSVNDEIRRLLESPPPSS